jgi:hypothetical protein
VTWTSWIATLQERASFSAAFGVPTRRRVHSPSNATATTVVSVAVVSGST